MLWRFSHDFALQSERGLPTFSNKVKKELDDKDKKHKKKHKKHKHRDKDKDRDKEKEKKDRDKDKDQGAKAINGEDRSRKHHKKVLLKLPQGLKPCSLIVWD